MTDTENVLRSDIDLNEFNYKQQSIIQSSTDEESQNESRSIKNDISSDKITNIHTFLFDILAFFSNFQPSLILEYCQETRNVNNVYAFL